MRPAAETTTDGIETPRDLIRPTVTAERTLKAVLLSLALVDPATMAIGVAVPRSLALPEAVTETEMIAEAVPRSRMRPTATATIKPNDAPRNLNLPDAILD
jgi:hypothetical protein